MRINVCSETKLLNIKGDGVNRAFVDCIELLKECGVEVLVNGEGRGDIMHCHTYGPYYFWRGLRYKGRRVFTVHVIPQTGKGTIAGWKFLMPFFYWYLKKVYNYADVCIAISPMVEKVLKEMGTTAKIVRMYNPISVEKWKRTDALRKKGREILGIKENDFCVLGVGQIQHRKGCSDFIEVAAKLSQFQFRWVGGMPMGIFNEGTFDLKGKISEAPCNVRFSGLFDMNEMSALYAAADVFLFPSYQENCPYAPLEAAASGMPVIFRNNEEYESLYNSPYLKGDKNEDFISVLLTLANDRDAYRKAEEMSAELLKPFDRNSIKKKLISIYIELINS